MKTINEFEVTDRMSFVKFLELLREDLKTNSGAWENKSLENFLEALSSYAEDVQGHYDHTSKINADIPSWKTFADIFKGARIYE